LSELTLGWEGAHLKLSLALLQVSSEISTVIKVDVAISTRAIDAVVSLFGGQFDIV
jgi:hypothetical protein